MDWRKTLETLEGHLEQLTRAGVGHLNLEADPELAEAVAQSAESAQSAQPVQPTHAVDNDVIVCSLQFRQLTEDFASVVVRTIGQIAQAAGAGDDIDALGSFEDDVFERPRTDQHM